MKLYAGTSGYSYPEWKGTFYPEDLPNAEMLGYYARHLPSVEINNTFYRLPNTGMVEKWSGAVPSTFRFSLKAAQKITHIKRLKNAEEETSYLFRTIRSLGEKLGVVLFQCPPNFRKDATRLKDFLSILPMDVRCAFEFRHASWFDDEVFETLRAHNIALCVADADDELEVPFVSTAGWGYMRLRRPDYTPKDLETWVKRIEGQNWDPAFVFFKHEEKGVGANLALKFLALAEGKPLPPDPKGPLGKAKGAKAKSRRG
ncbi:MAG: DUF72 domain-containing protein [Ignavibacteriales bacterium]|nr:DUF72 domain-containing protein [Ignavibacteriales bacterium]